MAEQDYHEMVLNSIHSSGAEEWYCPTCGRRFLMQWPPTYSKVILETGDETAIHSGGKAKLTGENRGPRTAHLPQPEINDESPDLQPVEEETLQPWLEWMETVGFEHWWYRDLQ